MAICNILLVICYLISIISAPGKSLPKFPHGSRYRPRTGGLAHGSIECGDLQVWYSSNYDADVKYLFLDEQQ